MGQAWKNIFQFGRETAGNYGVAVASTKRLKTYNLEPEAALDVIEPTLSDGSLFTQEFIDGTKAVTFEQELPLTYTGMLMLVDAWMGTDTYGSNGGITTGGGPFVHTFKIRELLNSMTLQAGIGDIPTGKVDRLIGAKIGRVTLGASGERVDGRVNLSWLARDWASNQTPTTLTAAALDVVMFKHLVAGSSNDGVTGLGTSRIRSFSLSIDNALANRRFGDALIAEPIRNGRPTVSLTIDIEYDAITARDSHYAFTQGAPILVFASGALGFSISMPKAYMKTPPRLSRDGMGIITQTLVWSPIGDDGSPETYLTCVVTNQQATITT